MTKNKIMKNRAKNLFTIAAACILLSSCYSQKPCCCCGHATNDHRAKNAQTLAVGTKGQPTLGETVAVR